MLFQRLFATEKAVASLAVDSPFMHMRIILVLFQCSFATKMAVAEDTRVVHLIHDCSKMDFKSQDSRGLYWDKLVIKSVESDLWKVRIILPLVQVTQSIPRPNDVETHGEPQDNREVTFRSKMHHRSAPCIFRRGRKGWR